MSSLDSGFPAAPLVDPQSGEATPAWRMFLQCLWRRTGETAAPAIGLSVATLSAALSALAAQVATLSTALSALAAQVAALIGLGTQPSVVVTAGASPYAYAAPSNGTLYVSGGGVTAATVQRGSGAAWPVGQFYGGHRLMAGDTLTVRYVAAPVMVFFPG